MIVLAERGELPASRTVAVFGVGLIGSALVEHLQRLRGWNSRHYPFAWTAPGEQVSQLLAIEAEVSRGSGPTHVVWSAGRAGFGAGVAEVEEEFRAFQAVHDLAARLAERSGAGRVVFHLLSSAGGLFEGRRHVSAETVPSPRRPYGDLKLRQEQALAPDGPLMTRVYRLTSVFGHLHPGRRRGLIPMLVLNGLRRKTTPITGRPSTLRDFTWVEDVARFLADEVMRSEEGAERATYLLASGVPTSILQVCRWVEALLGRRPYVSYSLDPSNCEDITFSRRATPAGWFDSDLRINVKKVYTEAIRRGFGAESARPTLAV